MTNDWRRSALGYGAKRLGGRLFVIAHDLFELAVNLRIAVAVDEHRLELEQRFIDEAGMLRDENDALIHLQLQRRHVNVGKASGEVALSFGALPGRSATDLAAAVVHDVEESLLRGKVASMLTLDIKGAFDAVLPGRLVQRLKQQGWPDNS